MSNNIFVNSTDGAVQIRGIPRDNTQSDIIQIATNSNAIAKANKAIQFSMFDKATWTSYDVVYADLTSYNGFEAGMNHSVYAAQNSGTKQIGFRLMQTRSLAKSPGSYTTWNGSAAFSAKSIGSSEGTYAGEASLAVTKPRRSISYTLDDNIIKFNLTQLGALNLPNGYRLYAKYTEKVNDSNFWLAFAKKTDYIDDVYHMPSRYKIVYNPLRRFNDGTYEQHSMVSSGVCKLVMHVIKASEYNEEIEEIDCNFLDWAAVTPKLYVSSTTRTNDSITVQYNPTNNPGTGSAFFFRVYIFDINGDAYLHQTSPDILYPQTSYTFTGLTQNTNYAIKAFRRVAFGTVPSPAITVKTLTTLPAVTVSNVTSTGARITWGPLLANESITITSSANTLYSNLTGTYFDILQHSNTSITYSIQKIVPGQPSAFVKQTVLTLPDTSLVTIANSVGNLQIKWTEVRGATSYKIYNNNTLLTTVSASTLTYTNTTIAAGSSVSIQVEAICPGNISTKSVAVTAVITLAAPVLSIASRSGVSATFSWTPVAGATSYVIGTMNLQDEFIDGSTTNTTFFDYSEEVDKKFYIRAKAGTAVSAPSNVVVYTTSSPPTKLQGTYSANRTSLTLTWTPAIGAGYTYYVYRATGERTGYQYEDVSSTTATSITIPVIPGTSGAQTYLVSSLPIQFQMQQVYDIVNYMPTVIGYLGMVPYNTPAAITTVYPKLTPVTISGATVNVDDVSIQWNPVICDGTADGVTYRIRRAYKGSAMPDIVTTDVSCNITYMEPLDAPVTYSISAEKNGCSSDSTAISLCTPPLLNFVRCSVYNDWLTANVSTKIIQGQDYRWSYNGIIPPELFSDSYFTKGNTNDTTGTTMFGCRRFLEYGNQYTIGLQAKNTILGTDVWSGARTVTFTAPPPQPIYGTFIFNASGNASSSSPPATVINMITESPPASVAVYKVVAEEYIPVPEAIVNTETNTVTIPDLPPNSTEQFTVRTTDANGIVSNMSDPITITTPYAPTAPRLELVGTNVILSGGDVDISENVFVNAITGTPITTKAGTVTTISVAELTSGISDFTLSIQVVSSNAFTATYPTMVGRSNILVLPVSHTANTLSSTSWLTTKLTAGADPADIKTVMRDNRAAFTESIVSLNTDIVNPLLFLDTVNPYYSRPSGVASIPVAFLNPKAGQAVDITDISSGMLYINAANGETVLLDISGVTYTTQITAGGVLYNSVEYGLNDIIQLGDTNVRNQGHGSVLLEIYVPPPPTPTVPCFLGSARVLTPNGYVRIAALRAGDRVKTADGRVVAISRVSVNEVAATSTTNPFVIPRGLYGAVRDIRVSPDHKILVDGAMIEARRAPGLKREEHQGTLTYYNLELPDMEDRMIVDGVTCESLAHVRRMVMSVNDFMGAIRRKYGPNISPQVLQRIKETCRVLADGRVDVPVMRH